MPVLPDASDFAVDEEASGSDEYREVILQQSVTMLAYMERTPFNSTANPGLVHPRMILGLTMADFTILMGAAIGAAGLLMVILTTVIIWHCCKFRGRPDKGYCLDNSTPDEHSIKPGHGIMLHSDSVVFLGTKANQVSTCAIGIKSNLCQSLLTRSQSVPLKEGKELPKLPIVYRPFSKKRPISQPIHLPIGSHHYRHLNTADKGLPSIPETAFRPVSFEHPNLYASCNALDGNCVTPYVSVVSQATTMKTRSLPLWGRTKARPLSTEDDINELYAKVSFSKKRKNRMRSDSAAAIAVNKSRTAQATPFAHKDTDSLVDNEAIVVYDERTAL